MARPRTPSEKRPDRQRNARLADWLAREKSAYLHATARRAGVPRWQREDVVQAGLLDFLRSFPGPEVPAKALAYCAVCVASEASKARGRYARKESHQASIPEREDGEEPAVLADLVSRDPIDVVIERDRLAELAERLAELTEEERAIVILAGAGFGPAEIARIRGLTARQVRKRIGKANQRLGVWD